MSTCGWTLNGVIDSPEIVLEDLQAQYARVALLEQELIAVSSMCQAQLNSEPDFRRRQILQRIVLHVERALPDSAKAPDTGKD